MGESKDSQPVEEDTESEAEGKGAGTLNDPLTHSDIEAPRAPFEADPES